MVKFSVLKDDFLVAQLELSLDKLEANQEYFLGRSSDCDLVIADQKISRNHFVLTSMSGMISIKNISKFDNLLVNGSKVSQAIISDSDQVKFYEYELKLEGLFESQSSVKQDEAFESHKQEQGTSTEIMSVELDKDSVEEVSEPGSSDFALEVASEKKESENHLTQGSSSQEAQKPFEDESSFSNDFLSDDSLDLNQDLFPEKESLTPVETEKDEPSFSRDSQTKVISHFKKYIFTISGPEIQREEFEFTQDYIVVGRSTKNCHVVLDDNDVSSIHAKFYQEKGKVFIEDLNSSNGVFVNGEKVKRSLLIEGDEVLIGSISFIISVKSKQLEESVGRLMPVDSYHQSIEERTQSLEMDHESIYNESGGLSKVDDKINLKTFSEIQASLKNPANRKRVLIGLCSFLMFVFLIIPSEVEKKEVSDLKKVEKRVLASDLNQSEESINNFSESDMKSFELSYKLARKSIEENNLSDALSLLDAIAIQNPDYKNVTTLLKNVRTSIEQIEEDKRQELLAREQAEKIKKVEDLSARISSALVDRKIESAHNYLIEIAEIDPENEVYDRMQRSIAAVKLEIEKEEEEKRKKQEAIKFFTKKMNLARKARTTGDYSKALDFVSEAISVDGIESELSVEGNKLYSEIKTEMTDLEDSLLTKARDYKRGDDFKNSYESYKKVMKINPSHSEALKEMGELVGQLHSKAQYVFREGLVAESISLYRDARAKYEEVLQVAPSDSKYYKKAKKKLNVLYFE